MTSSLSNLDCAKCGACTAVCPVYQITGRESLTARGKLHLLGRLDPAGASDSYAEILSRCLLCGACADSCPRQLDIPARIVAARAQLKRTAGFHFWRRALARRLLARPALLRSTMALVNRGDKLLRHLPANSGLRLRLGLLPAGIPAAANNNYPEFGAEPEPAGAALSYFSGCLATHLEPNIAKATAGLSRYVTGAAPAETDEQGCCGQAAFAGGDLDQARVLAKRNIETFGKHDLPILTSCASCYCHLLRYPELLADEPAWAERAGAFAGRLLEFSTFFNDSALVARGGSATVFYHDPCHLRFNIKVSAPPRQLLRNSGLEVVELPNGPRCCGLGGLFHLAHPELSAGIRDRLLADFQPLSADLVTTTCSGCLLQWRQALSLAGSPVPARHLAEILADRLLVQPQS